MARGHRLLGGLVVVCVLLRASSSALEPKTEPLTKGKQVGPVLSAEVGRELVKTLAKSGWKAERETGPDRARLELRASAFAKPSKRSLAALRSRAFGGEDLTKLRSIVRSQVDPGIRAAAFDALAASPDPRAQPLLVELYGAAKDERQRRRILGALDPIRGGEEARALLETEAKSSVAKRKAGALARLGMFDSVGKKLKKPSAPALVLDPAIARAVGELEAAATARLRFESEETDDVLGRCPDDDVVRAPEGAAGGRTTITRNPTPQPTRDPGTPHHFFRKVGAAGTLVAPGKGESVNPGKYRQIVVFPAGYGENDYDDFIDDASLMISNMGNLPEGV